MTNSMLERPLHVLYVIDSLGGGGAERSTASMITWLRAKGVQIDVATLRRAEEGSENEVRAAGVEPIVLRAANPLSRLRELRRVVRSLDPDVVHTALFASDVLGRLAAARTNSVVVSSLTDVPRAQRSEFAAVPRWKTRLVDLIDAWTARWFADRLHAVTPGLATLYSAAFPKLGAKITVVERGRDIGLLGERTSERRVSVRAALSLDDRAPVLIAIGRHEHQKGHADLVRAVGQLVESHPDVTLLIAGRSGRATAELEATIDQTGTGPHVRVLGHRSDVGDLLAASDVFVQASHHEGAAGAALEAMALGLPIVSTDLAGLAGILVHEHNCILVPISDSAAMAAAIGRLLDEPQIAERLGSVAQAEFAEGFTMDRVGERMLGLYRELAGDRPVKG